MINIVIQENNKQDLYYEIGDCFLHEDNLIQLCYIFIEEVEKSCIYFSKLNAGMLYTEYVEIEDYSFSHKHSDLCILFDDFLDYIPVDLQIKALLK